jgi:drug/metabolite transporter (DMT)-like permease
LFPSRQTNYPARRHRSQQPADWNFSLSSPHPSIPAAARRSRLTGIGLMCAAVVCFALLDTTAKWLSGRMDTIQVIGTRFAVHSLLSFLVLNPWTVPGLLRTRRPWLQVGRSALLLGATAFNFAALRYLQLDQTATIMFAAPILVAGLAGPMLGEWLDWRRWTAIGLGFTGVLLVTRPGHGGIHPAAAFSLLAATCTALYSLTTRMLAAYDRTETTSFYSSLVGTVAAAIPMASVWTPPSAPSTIAGMVAVGGLGWIGHWMLIAAHRHAPAPVLAPFGYSQMLWMTVTGALVFGHLPSAWTVAGAAVVFASGVYLVTRERSAASETELL